MKLNWRTRGIVVSVVTRLRARQSRIQFLAGAGDFSLVQNFPTGPGANSDPCLVVAGGSFRGGKAAGTWSWQLNVCQVPRLRMSEAVLLLRLYAFMARTGLTVTFLTLRCVAWLTPYTVKTWEKWLFHLFKILRQTASMWLTSSFTKLVLGWQALLNVNMLLCKCLKFSFLLFFELINCTFHILLPSVLLS